MRIKLRAWDKVNNRMQSWEELLSGREFKAKLQDPEAHGMVLMMWTGLTDENGVEVYEGDILRVEFEYIDYDGVSHTEFCIGVVEYSENRGCYMVDAGYPESEELVNWLEDTTVVLGNIYENPELIQKEGNPTTK